MTAHPAIAALRDAAAVHSHGDELEAAIRAALVAAAEAMRKRVLSIPVLRDHPANLTRIGIELIDEYGLVARLLGEEPAPFTHDEIRAFLEGNAAEEGKSLGDYLEEK